VYVILKIQNKNKDEIIKNINKKN